MPIVYCLVFTLSNWRTTFIDLARVYRALVSWLPALLKYLTIADFHRKFWIIVIFWRQRILILYELVPSTGILDFDKFLGLCFYVTITNAPFIDPSHKFLMRSKAVHSWLLDWKNNPSLVIAVTKSKQQWFNHAQFGYQHFYIFFRLFYFQNSIRKLTFLIFNLI